MSRISVKASNTRLSFQRTKWSKKDLRLKPFGFCCSLDRFDPLSRYDQRVPPYESSLTAITSVHECPVAKMQMKFSMPRLPREKKRLAKRTSDTEDQQRLKNGKLSYFQTGRNNRSIKRYLEDEIALAKDIFWAEKQRIYEASDKAIRLAKKKHKEEFIKMKTNPRWYQDFSPDQMKNLMKLENVMRTDYEETKADGTQTTLIAIGIISTFFKLNPNTIKKLHKSCNLNSVDFLREIYRILTGNDFSEEGYKKVYNCNERIILSAIAFLTLPETVEELHRRMPAMIIPRLPPKPKPPTCLARRKSSCPYKEELFRCPDWAGYRNALQKWRKQCKLIANPKVILPVKGYGQFFINDRSEIRKRGKDISTEYLEEINTEELQKISSTIYGQKDLKDKDYSREKNLEMEKLATFGILRSPGDGKRSDFMIRELSGKPGTVEYKIYGPPKPPGASQKSWLGKKDPHYVIAGVSAEDSQDCPVTYEITGVTNVTPSNSDERFFAVLKLGDRSTKVFPSGRENLSRNWQEWLQNADAEYRQLAEDTDELMKSVQAIMKSAFPGPVCDSCCSCRQTRRFEKLQQNKIDKTPIDIVQNEERNTHVIDSTVVQSSGQNPTESPIINQVASNDEIKTNIIINGVTKETGHTQYYISGIQRDKIHVPSRMPDPPVPQLVRNVPSCLCAIKQMTEKDVSPSASKEDISWTKEEGLCPGKKYRPDEPGAYSCKTYPGDKFCRNNPFMKEIVKMERRKIEKREEEEIKEKTEPTEMIKKETQILEKKITERKKDKFIPDPDYPAYDDPWNILRTAPSEEIMKTDYEATLKLTSPTWPTTSLPLKTQERQNDISSLKELKKIKNDILDKEIDKKTSKISLKSSKKIQKEVSKEKKGIIDMKKKKKEPIFLKKITVNKRGTKSSSTISKSTPIFKTEKKQQTKSPLPNKPAKQSNKIYKPSRYSSVKKNKNKYIVDEAETIDNRKREMARLKNMFKSFSGIFSDIQPAVLPEELPPLSQRNPEEKTEGIINSSTAIDEEESRRTKKGPCGWRTKSEQKLPAKKTLAYLCEPDYPLEMMAVRPGGRPCQCRENRNKKKILKYNIGGLVEQKRDGRRARRTKLEEENRIIDGVLYFTPSASPRRSDEYIPEYDLLKSPYDMCVSEATDGRLKLIEKYSGPKSLVEKTQKKSKSCNCNNVVTKEERLVDQKKNIEEARKKLMESKSPEERWKIALKDAALMDYFTQRDDNTPCWTSCKKIVRSARPRRLKVVKPVCECKYERKIVERNEEGTKWKARQRRLKALKKQSFMHIVDTSRPMIEDRQFIISDVKRIPQEGGDKDDIKYCISGVAEDVFMSPPQQIVDGLRMSTPFQTPASSEEDILRTDVPHRHWSPTNIPPGPLPRKNAILKEEMERRRKARNEAFKLIYGDESEQDASCLATRSYREAFDEQKLMKKVEKKKDDTRESHTSIKKKTSEAIMGLQSLSKKSSSKIGRQTESRKEITGEVVHEKKKYFEKAAGEVDDQQNVSYKRVIGKTGEKIDDGSYRINGGGDKKYINNKFDLIAIMKDELKKLAAEGYAFAKLPKCYLMPQLQDWIMYREGVVFSETDKKNLMRATVAAWELTNSQTSKIVKPLRMTKYQLKRLTYDQAEKMKKKIEMAREVFHSKVRKTRVSYARTMWNTMEYGKFPSASFKRTFFTYMASKEADGHVYRPWLPSEARERDFEFSCY